MTDPADAQAVRTLDALGRLTKVVEDPAGKNYTTSYTYLQFLRAAVDGAESGERDGELCL